MFDTTLSHRGKKGMLALSLGFAACTPLVLTGCGGGGGDSSGGNAIVPLSNAKSVSIPQTGGDVALDKVNNVGYTVKFPANALAAVTTVTVTPIASANLPTSITKGVKGRAFTADPANTYLTAFKIDAGTVTKFNVPVTVGATGLTNYAAGTILNIALLTNNQWNDVGTLIVDASGNLSSQLTSYTLPGIVAPGTYVIYKQGTTTGTTTLANFGVALVADDQSGGPGMQVINLYDASGNVLPTPAIKTLAFSGASDLDGQAMTPDGKYGILVDGGNTIRFFSGVNTGVPLASANTLNISAYGGDGDSVAIMPNGDEAVVAGDSTQLLVVSGITTGTPAEADTIDAPGRRDGVVISNDGKVLLARGYSGLTVYSITPKTAAAGALGGQIAHTYTKTMDITTAGASGLEDGRDGMAISPTDSSRAVVVPIQWQRDGGTLHRIAERSDPLSGDADGRVQSPFGIGHARREKRDCRNERGSRAADRRGHRNADAGRRSLCPDLHSSGDGRRSRNFIHAQLRSLAGGHAG